METTVSHVETRAQVLMAFSTSVWELRSSCTCGAVWTHPLNRTQEELDSIFLSHVRYFNNRTMVL